MLEERDETILLHIIEHCNRIISKIEKVTEATFIDDIDCQEIVCFNLLQIGELSKHLTKDFLKKYDSIPWIRIMSLRDHVVHGYKVIQFSQIFKISKIDVPQLKKFCSQVIEENK